MNPSFRWPGLLLLPLLALGCGGDPAPLPEDTRQASPATQPAVPAVTSEVAGPTDPFGYYFLDADKPQPSWAQAIDHLHLSTFDMKGDEMVTVPLYGFIRPNSGDDYRLVDPKLDGAHLSFTTEEVKGVSFDFDGRFLASGNFPETPPEGVVLTGRLRQRQGGQVAGEMDAEFLYTAGD
jgi:hypothetical protein